MASPLIAAVQQGNLDAAVEVLTKATAAGQVRAASLYVRRGTSVLAKSFGASKSMDDMFLIASISKPMSVAALMTLYDKGEFQLDDAVRKYIPEFTDGRRGEITVRQLLTHVSGLPDQLPENRFLRQRHANLSEFVDEAIRTPLLFTPGSRYSYSSMGILLASELAARISGSEFTTFISEVVFQPLKMQRSALGLGEFPLEETMQCQVADAAPESGAGDPEAKSWDWNSLFWRKLGSPWGGVHSSAPDVARFFAEFIAPKNRLLKRETSRLMLRNHNRHDLTPRGLGFAIGTKSGSPGCSPQTFGHSGSTGTLAWADPASDTICVVLTTLPSSAVNPHPRQLVSERIAKE